MSRGQDNGTTILLGLKGYRVAEVVEREEKIVVKTEVKGRIIDYCIINRTLPDVLKS
jgi:hypothetical protein